MVIVLVHGVIPCQRAKDMKHVMLRHAKLVSEFQTPMSTR